MTLKLTRRVALTFAAALTFSTALAGAAQAQTTLSFLVDNADASVQWANQLVTDFEAINPDHQDHHRDASGRHRRRQLIKTRLATGEMTDIFNYNAGSLFQAINPIQNIVDLNDEPWQANVLSSFKSVVTATDAMSMARRSAPRWAAAFSTTRRSMPTSACRSPRIGRPSWPNNEKIKAAGIDGRHPVLRRQLDGTAVRAGRLFQRAGRRTGFRREIYCQPDQLCEHPAAMRGFEHGKEVFDAGFLNEDYSAATLDDALRQLATGEGAHYPMLTFAISNVQANYPENLNDVGFFAIPGDNAASNGLTVWMPAAVYIAKTSQHQAEAKKFVAYLASVAGCDSLTKAGGATGPYLVKGCELPADVPAAVADLLPYFQTEGTTAPALEFVSPVRSEPVADHRRSRLRHSYPGRRRCALRRRRQEAGSATRSCRLVSSAGLTDTGCARLFPGRSFPSGR